MPCSKRNLTRGEVGMLLNRSGAGQEAILDVKEELLEIRERLLTVLKFIDDELGLGQGLVMAP